MGGGGSDQTWTPQKRQKQHVGGEGFTFFFVCQGPPVEQFGNHWFNLGCLSQINVVE